jgi:uncharacterized protein (TIGR00297 family)
MQLFIGFIIAALIGLLSYRVGVLNRSGAWAATLTGGLIFGLGGWPWAALLLVFFASSSGLSRAFRKSKSAVNEKFSKGSQRDAGQVLANGGLGALLAASTFFIPRADWLWIAYIGAMAAVNADTWATELGVLSRSEPRLITTGRRVERGTSGGISLTGYLAVLAGAALIGLVAAIFSPYLPFLLIIGISILGGLAGSTLDSLLGATWQAIYWCPQCRKETERHPQHACGTPTTRLRGFGWLNNDLVNFACSLAGAASAIVAGWLLL